MPRKLEIALQVLIVATLLAYAVETLPDLRLSIQALLRAFEVFTFVVLVVGLGIVAIPAGLVASALSAARLSESE